MPPGVLRIQDKLLIIKVIILKAIEITPSVSNAYMATGTAETYPGRRPQPENG
jgi:hypothetical protein